MPKPKRRTPRDIPLKLHPRALREMQESLDAATQADIAVIFKAIDKQSHQRIASLLEPRTEPKVFQWERSNPAGTLRVVFAWGQGCLWFIGAFIKANDPQGERLIKRILPRAAEVEHQGVKHEHL